VLTGCQLDGASAHVGHQDSPGRERQRTARSQVGQARLVIPRDELDRDAEAVAASVQERAPVARISQRAGGNADHLGRAELGGDGGHTRHAVEGGLESVVAQLAVLLHDRAEAQHLFVRAQLVQLAAGVGVSDQQVERIGSEIQCRELHAPRLLLKRDGP
jgi:hypothetical protein